MTARLSELVKAEEQKRALLRHLLLQKAAEAAAPLPLSYGQRALWALHQQSPESTAYNVTRCLRVGGELNVAAFRHSFEKLVSRHSSLRATFTSEAGTPVQRINNRVEGYFIEEDATGWDEPRLRERLQAEAARPFDLEGGPLLRVRLYRRAAREHILLLAFHHIAIDFWSLSILLGELAQFYEAELTGAPPEVKRLGLQYSDYVRWQLEMLAGPEGEAHRMYWESQLASPPPPLELPFRRRRGDENAGRAAAHSFTLEPELAERLRRLARSKGTTLYTLLLASFQAMLYRYTYRADFAIGSPLTGRSRPAFEETVGYFVNPVVLRVRAQGGESFGAFLERTRANVLAALEHQEFPFPLLVERLRPARDTGREPLFQIMFAMQKAHMLHEEGLTAFALDEAPARIDLGRWRLESVALEPLVAQFALTLVMAEVGPGLSGSFLYDPVTFDAADVARLASHFRAVLTGVLADPECRLAELSLLGEDERSLLARWGNHGARPRAGGATVHRLFEEQAARTPDADAVSFGGGRLTYRELDEKSNRLANYLRGLGVGVETRVGVCVRRSPEMVIGLLGTLKAGGAYVPLDPEYPSGRIGFMLSDSGIKILLTEEQLLDRLRGFDVTLVPLDAEWGRIRLESDARPDSQAGPENVAYVSYTSGSTGQPKGAEIPHRSIAGFIFDVDYAEFGPAQTFLQYSSISWDALTLELWPALLRGGRCVLHAGRGLTPAELEGAVRREGVNTLWLTSSLFNAVMDSRPSALEGVTQLLIGGEAVSRAHVTRALGLLPRTRIVNGYGPSECTVFACCYAAPRGAVEDAATVPIGRPIGDREIYLLDRLMNQVSVGMAGEVYIGGASLARGYLNRRALTAEKFVPHPFSTEPGARLYRTGDVARFLDDGNLEFVGRVDDQVKVRGFRIELGEIEATLAAHEDVAEAAALAREDAAGDKRLVAYVVARRGNVTAEDLRAFLKSKLPRHMLPGVFVMLDALPKNSNGKVDRRALPPPPTAEASQAGGNAAPRNATEATLAEVWAQVLGLERIGVHDNFFGLGGDSIQSIQVASRASHAGLRLTPMLLYSNQTVAELAAAVGTAPAVAPAEQGAVTGAVPLLPVQRWFFEQELPEAHHWNQSAVFEIQGVADPAVFKQAVRSLLAHHDALRLRFSRERGGWRQIIAPADCKTPFTFVDLSALPADEGEAAFLKTAARLQASFDLSEGPILCVMHFRFGPGEPERLLVIIHHLAVDGVSWRIIYEDLQAAYEQLRRGRAVELPPKTASLKAWAERLTTYARSDELRREADSWLYISEEAERRGIPADYADGLNLEASACTVSDALTCEETGALLREVPAVYHTQINDALLCALSQAFARWAGEPALLLDLEGHGREPLFAELDTSRTVGWLTALFPVLLRLPEASDPGDALKAVREQLRRVPNRGVGFGVARYIGGDAQVAEKLRALPRAEVGFNYLGQFDPVAAGDSSLRWLHTPCGPVRSGAVPRAHLIDVDAYVWGGRLRLDWTYAADVHRPETIESLAHSTSDALRALVEHCRALAARSYAPSDFPLAPLDEGELDRLAELVNESDAGETPRA
jgi:amino acid adenylation domain-containing protein/non-ribosomal peptide synthase protein (TIGR01720 family)